MSRCVIFYVKESGITRFRHVCQVALHPETAEIFCRQKLWDVAIKNGDSIRHFSSDDPSLVSEVNKLFRKV